MTSSIPFALPPVLSQRQFMQYYAIARAMGHSGGLEGTQNAYQAQYAWSTIEQITKGQPADKPPVVEDPRVEALEKRVRDLTGTVEKLVTVCALLRTLVDTPVSESPGPQVSQS